MRRWVFLTAVLVACLAGGRAAAMVGEPHLEHEIGEPFPDLTFPGLLEPGDYRALGLERGSGPVRLSEIPGDLLILEFFNRYCITCQRQVPYLVEVFRRGQQGDLAGRVRVLAVGVGNRPVDLRRFRQETGAVYPMTSDPLFERWMELGDPGGTPFTLFLLRREGRWILADFHLGLQGDTEILARARVMLEGRVDLSRRAVTDSRPEYHPPLGLTPEERAARARSFLSRVAGRPVEVERLVVEGVEVYRAREPGGAALDLYARISSRDPVCDVCHAVHFLLAFDRRGRVRGFEPIHVTKFGNEPWSREDAERMDRILAGRPMEGLRFDPETDAVTSATMSSALIFDEARRTAALVAKLPGS